MVQRPCTELIEIDVEQLSYVPGTHVDRFAVARRWWDAAPAPTTGMTAAGQTTPAAGTVATTVLTGSTSFWRIVDVPGDQLERVLGAWWVLARHDDGHLRLGEPFGVSGVWQLDGGLRTTPISGWLAIDVRLASYARFWSLLELTPRRHVRPTRRYFRVGHDALDVFAAALRDLALTAAGTSHGRRATAGDQTRLAK